MSSLENTREFDLGSPEDLRNEARSARAYAISNLKFAVGGALITEVFAGLAGEAYIHGSGNVFLGVIATAGAVGAGYGTYLASKDALNAAQSAGEYEEMAKS